MEIIDTINLRFPSWHLHFLATTLSFCNFPGNLITNICAFVFHTKNVARGEKDYLDIWRKILDEREESVYSNNLWTDYHYYVCACVYLLQKNNIYSTLFSKNFWFLIFFSFFNKIFSNDGNWNWNLRRAFHSYESKLVWSRIW